MARAVPRHKKILWALYGCMFFLSFHTYFLAYIQSTLLNQFLPEKYLLYVYSLAAAVSIIIFLNASRILRKLKTKRFILWLILVEAILCLVISWVTIPAIVITAFALEQAVIPILWFCLDVLIEDHSQNRKTGLIRSLAFTSANIALVISPLIAGSLSAFAPLQSIYYLSLIFLVPFFALIWHYRRYIKEPDYRTKSIHATLHEFFFKTTKYERNIRRIFLVNIVLQSFYTWMVIYSPLYLLHLGFDWSQIGLMFSIMLLPFLFFELPLGPLADKYIGEKELIIVGFIIMGISTIVLAFISSRDVLVWALALFATRTGASFVEIMSETYFFKQVTGSHAYDIGLFRLTRPLSQLVAPLIASLSIFALGEQYSFIVLGIICILGIQFTFSLIDTR